MTGDAGGGSRSRRNAEDRSRPADVRVHARLGDAEELRDLLGAESAGDRAEHLTLTFGQRFDGLSAANNDAARKEVPRKNSDQK